MVIYLCNGKNPDCKNFPEGCYLNGGECRHTRHVEYAKNFKKDIYADYCWVEYVEKEDKDHE